MYKLRDFQTKKEVKPKNLIFTGKASPWEVVIDLEEVKRKINGHYFKKIPPFVSKYLPFMPISNYANFVSLAEGATPLISSKSLGEKLGIKLYFKYEAQNPTGSFKDRGSAVEITKAQELKAKAVVVASTGNMAASCACYAAAAGISCFVFVPEGTPPSKLAQVISYGGKLVQIKGNYNDATNLAKRIAEKLGFYLAGDYAFRIEGQKTAAFEIVDQLFYQPPDIVIIPMGCGTNLSSYFKGFDEYFKLGFIKKIPQLIGVQAEGAPAIVRSFKRKKRKVSPLKRVETIASSIAISSPLDGVKALEGIYSSKGKAMAVSDKEILEAQYLLAKEEGLFVESASASCLAALIKLTQEKSLENSKVVCVLTGNGLKDPSSILKIAIKPPIIFPEIREFLSLYQNSFFEGKNVAFIEKEEVLFSKPPKIKEIQKYAYQFFKASFSKNHLQKIKEKIVKFLKKGKVITFADFQDIIQDVLEALPKKRKKVFSVKNFEVKTAKDKKPQAFVLVTMNGKKNSARATGVGPVDAVINALKKAGGKKIVFSLTDYKVEIRSKGTDAVVCVELKLTKGGRTSLGQGVSPDIIQASIEAFEEAYNGFL